MARPQLQSLAHYHSLRLLTKMSLFLLGSGGDNHVIRIINIYEYIHLNSWKGYEPKSKSESEKGRKVKSVIPEPQQEKVGEEVKVEEVERGRSLAKARQSEPPRSHQTGSVSFRSQCCAGNGKSTLMKFRWHFQTISVLNLQYLLKKIFLESNSNTGTSFRSNIFHAPIL